MARQANIFSFEEALGVSSRSNVRQTPLRSGSQAPSARSRSRRGARYADEDWQAPRSNRASHTERSTRSRNAYRNDPWLDEPESPRANRASRANGTNRANASGRSNRAARSASAGRARAANTPEPARDASSAREERRRTRNKARAERMFAKQFEGEQQADVPAEGAPRAALYEGKMGSTHRKSARMQRSLAASPQSAKLNPAGWFANLRISPRVLKAVTAAICVALVGVFLYTPAQQYYQAQRDRDRLAAEYAELEQRNDTLDDQNSALASNAGMEDAVRQRYGYVVQGDETAVVTGLADQTVDTARDGKNIEANVLASSVKAPEEWYTPYLDAFFGVS